MTSQNNGNGDDNDPKFQPRDTELRPPPLIGSPTKEHPASVPPAPFIPEDDGPVVQVETQNARAWAARHPWLASHDVVVKRVTSRGLSKIVMPPKPFSGNPYGSYNGGALMTGALAAAQTAGNHHFGEATVLSADSQFVAPSRLTQEVTFRGRFIKALSKFKILVDVTWSQGDEDQGSTSVILEKARPADVVPALLRPEASLLETDAGEDTQLCVQLIKDNPYFARLGVNITHVSKDVGLHAYLLPQERNLNTRGNPSDSVIYTLGDAVVCYGSLPWIGVKPVTSQLKFERYAQAPADAILFAEASVYVALPRNFVKVHGQVYYLDQNGDNVVVGLYESLIVGKAA